MKEVSKGGGAEGGGGAVGSQSISRIFGDALRQLLRELFQTFFSSKCH